MFLASGLDEHQQGYHRNLAGRSSQRLSGDHISETTPARQRGGNGFLPGGKLNPKAAEKEAWGQGADLPFGVLTSVQAAGTEPSQFPWEGRAMDNYDGFIERLDSATANLERRRDLLDKSLDIVQVLYKQNNTGLELWSQRRGRVSDSLDRYSGKPAGYRALSELNDAAVRMETLFRNRTRRIDEHIAVIRERSNVIDKSLAELEKSRAKLHSSRIVSQDRENLNKAIAELSGTPDRAIAAVPDAGLRDALQEAREAIILAEALLEVKGIQP